MSVTIGKLGIVRLTGEDLTRLREQCFARDGNRCVDCLNWVADHFPDWHDRKAHMAHVQNKRMYGDTLENVRTKCRRCHMDIEHSGGKVVPAKA
ncbi:hypothetical protein [Pseudomonas sp.]|uniref:HNH endonuclease n=1 Tax=Pseudomonas sp. TaxID=306 RepID=UPI0026025D42|nr:hypothetical protein [Pseudomonas sp.]